MNRICAVASTAALMTCMACGVDPTSGGDTAGTDGTSSSAEPTEGPEPGVDTGADVTETATQGGTGGVADDGPASDDGPATGTGGEGCPPGMMGGDRTAELFRSEFEDVDGVTLLRYVGKRNAHPGGGYVSFMGGEILGELYYNPSDGCGGLEVQDVIIDSTSDAQGGPPGAQTSALKTQYRVMDNCGQSFQKNTTIIAFEPTRDLYMRFYQKWSDTWLWPSIQQKFAKIKSSDGLSSQNFFFKKTGEMLVNYIDMGVQTSSILASEDDLPIGSVDLPIGQWHEIQMHVKMSDPGQSNGVLEYWMNGVQHFGLYDIENNNGNTEGIGHVELQHVYETGDPKTGPVQDMPTWMKNIVLSTEFIPSECGGQ